MANENAGLPSLPHAILRMLETVLTGGMTFDTLTNILALLCLVNILQRSQPAPAIASPPPANTQNANPLHRVLGDLMKNEGGGSGDMLGTLLPLLNNPQIKSKLTPGNIATVLGLMNTLGGAGDSKQEKSDKTKQENNKDTLAATITSHPEVNALRAPAEPAPETHLDEAPSKGQYLHWKTNF